MDPRHQSEPRLHAYSGRAYIHAPLRYAPLVVSPAGVHSGSCHQHSAASDVGNRNCHTCTFLYGHSLDGAFRPVEAW